MTARLLILTFHEDPVETRALMTDAVEALPTFAHVRALRPSGTHSVLVHSAAGWQVHALHRKQEHIVLSSLPARIRINRAIDIYLRGVDVALVGALEGGDLIARESLEIIAALRR